MASKEDSEPGKMGTNGPDIENGDEETSPAGLTEKELESSKGYTGSDGIGTDIEEGLPSQPSTEKEAKPSEFTYESLLPLQKNLCLQNIAQQQYSTLLAPSAYSSAQLASQ
jgi:hypothetical protein